MKNRNRKSKKNREKYTMYFVLAALSAVIVLTVLGWRYYIRTMGMDSSVRKDQKCDRHYVMIADDTDSLLWQDIYANAKAEAVEQNAYLELLGAWDSGRYSTADYMNIAVASKVDGIIVKPDGTARMRAAIDEADAAGIPVITVLEDETASSRRSFVGMNSYQMGTTYGQQILRCLNQDTRNVMVLLNRGDAGKDLVFKQLKATVQEGLPDGQKVEIDSMTVSPGSTFGAEEVIRELFHDEETSPDILVCMDEMNSECAYYAMVDYNQVGSVQLIGYYQSENMLGAVQKGIIPIVIAIDTEQVGRYSIQALEEYYSMGYASSYFSVDLDIITRQNVADYLPGEQ